MNALLSIFLNIFFSPYKLFTGKSVFALCDKEAIFAKNVRIRRFAKIRKSKIGKYTSIANGTLIINSEIGSFCSISSDCFIGMGKHPLSYVSTSTVFLGRSNQFRTKANNTSFADYGITRVGNDVWVGHGAMIRTGVSIGDGAVIGAGAVVTHDVPPYAIVAGVPARIIKYRFDETIIKGLLESKWWDKNVDELKKLSAYFDDPAKFIELTHPNN